MNKIPEREWGQEKSAEYYDDEGLDLSMYLGMIIDNRFLIGGVTAIFLSLSIFYALFSTPIYSADALLQIEGRGGSIPAMDDLAALMGTSESSSVTEIEILKSRKVVGGVVDKFNWTVNAYPRYFPLIGRYLARNYETRINEKDEKKISDPILGLENYAWGGELIQVSRFDVPKKFINQRFLLRAGESSGFELLTDDGEVLLAGKVGKLAENNDGLFKLFVKRLKARQGTEFSVVKLSRSGVIGRIQSRIRIIEKGTKTGILHVSMTGPNPIAIASTIHELTQSYLRQNIERHSEESKMMLDFISSQLPQLRSNVNASEKALNMYRESKGTIDISYEIQSLIQRIAKIEVEISSLKIERTELAHRLTEDHPVLHGIDKKIAILYTQKAELDKKLQVLPETELQTAKLNRDVAVANELYTLLLNKSQELKVSKAGVIGSARIIDSAVASEHPIKPKKTLIIVLGLMLGFISGVLAVVIKGALNKTVSDSSLIERHLSYPIYAEIPFSEVQRLSDKANRKRKTNKIELLAYSNNDDRLVESMRSLRTSIQFALLESDGNVITISGPGPETGKSFVASNFSYVMADAGKKVLLVDADLRKGHLYKYFELNKEPGLSGVISGTVKFNEVVNRKVLHENLDVITTGIYPPNPSELLLGQAFSDFIEEIKTKYDIVVLDTPPVLSVTDAAIIGRYASANFMLVRSGFHHMREIYDAFKRFEQNGVTMKGVIFNGVQFEKRGYGYGYGYGYSYKAYQYSYK